MDQPVSPGSRTFRLGNRRFAVRPSSTAGPERMNRVSITMVRGRNIARQMIWPRAAATVRQPVRGIKRMAFCNS